MKLRFTRDVRPTREDHFVSDEGPILGLKAMRKRRLEPTILTPCDPRKHCHVCEARLDAVFGSADKQAKYRHQATDNGRQAVAAIQLGLVEHAVAFARRAWTYALMVTT